MKQFPAALNHIVHSEGLSCRRTLSQTEALYPTFFLLLDRYIDAGELMLGTHDDGS
jgi:hypothetical protein